MDLWVKERGRLTFNQMVNHLNTGQLWCPRKKPASCVPRTKLDPNQNQDVDSVGLICVWNASSLTTGKNFQYFLCKYCESCVIKLEIYCTFCKNINYNSYLDIKYIYNFHKNYIYWWKGKFLFYKLVKFHGFKFECMCMIFIYFTKLVENALGHKLIINPGWLSAAV